MTRKTTLWIAAALLLIGAGATTRSYLSETTVAGNTPAAPAQDATDSATREALPGFQLTDIDGRQRDITEWQGKVVVLNFWATWCPPCRKEIPTFKALQAEYGGKGVQFIGIALDREELVRDFANAEAMNYPQLVGHSKALELGQKLGNRMSALPFTIVVDRNGRIAERIFGEWSREEAINTFNQLL